MIGVLKRRFARLQKSCQRRLNNIAVKISDAHLLLAKKYGLLERKKEVLFIGYAESALGLGESFRNMLKALDSAGMRFSIYPFSKGAESRYIGPFLDSKYDRTGLYDINVAYIQTSQLPDYFVELRRQIIGARYNILRTYWELSEAPPAWRGLIDQFDELWVPNSFVEAAFRRIFDKTITVIPVCINVDRIKMYRREHFRLRRDQFLFLFSFDYHSGSARKNPLGVLQAFEYAFPDQETKVGLVIKSTGPRGFDATASRFLENASKLDTRITVLDEPIGRNEMLSLIDNCDCYISLHRSEGFGLGMAEALALGKPVIATDYSGNHDFINSATGFPVPYSLRALLPEEYPMSEGQSWAEPDLNAAIKHMQAVFNDPEQRLERAARGQRYIKEHYSEKRVARIIADRIGEIREGFIKKG